MDIEEKGNTYRASYSFQKRAPGDLVISGEKEKSWRFRMMMGILKLCPWLLPKPKGAK